MIGDDAHFIGLRRRLEAFRRSGWPFRRAGRRHPAPHMLDRHGRVLPPWWWGGTPDQLGGGGGEEYLIVWQDWWRAADPTERADYAADYRPPSRKWSSWFARYRGDE